MGKKYFIIKNLKKKNHKNFSNNKILVSFGGSDNTDQTSKTLKALRDHYNSKFKIFACIGKNYKNRKKIKNNFKKIKNIFFFSTEQLSNKLNNFKYIIGACGQSLLERIYLEKYSLSAITSFNQYLLAKNLKKFHYTKTINLNSFPKKIKINKWRIEINKFLVAKKSMKIKNSLIDKKGIKRLSKIILEYI